MTSRERFEAKFLELGGERASLRPHVGTYLYSDMQIAWSLWQAAERDTLERCLEVLAKNDDISDAEDDLKELLNEQ